MTPRIVDNPPRPNGAKTQSLRWTEDPIADLTFAFKEDTAYIITITDGIKVTGRDIMEAFRPISNPRRVKVLEAGFDRVDFWEQMLSAKLIDDWGMESASSIL